MKANNELKIINSQLNETIEKLNSEITNLTEQVEFFRGEYDNLEQYLRMIGLEVEDFKRNFNNGVLYIVKPKTKLIKDTSEMKEIDRCDENYPINYFEVRNGMNCTTVGLVNCEQAIIDIFNRKEIDIYDIFKSAKGEIVDGFWQGAKRFAARLLARSISIESKTSN